MLYRCILPNWAAIEFPHLPRVKEGEYDFETAKELNSAYYNIYYLPNFPAVYDSSSTVDGSHIDVFQYLFVDMDLKEGKYASKDQFIEQLSTFLSPSRIVDSGNGMHAYWAVSDLDAKSFLRLQRRLIRLLNTDEAVCKIYQLMRVPGTVNTKNPDDLKLCEVLYEDTCVYTSEEVAKHLPPLGREDEEYCNTHYDKTYEIAQDIQVSDKLPAKWGQLLKSSKEAKEIWLGNTDDRSKSDYRLGHLMFSSGFTKEEAMSVLINTAKALGRSPKHRISYAQPVIDKIWTFEMSTDKDKIPLSNTVREILSRNRNSSNDTRFPCWNYIDSTEHGFRTGQVIGLVAGSGVGKTAIALNMFMGFVQNNPDYDHFFVSLEQPDIEIAQRWQRLCGEKTHLYDKVHILGNYAPDGSFRHLSFDDIRDHLLKFKEETKKSVGCVVIDHIAALKKTSKNGESEGLIEICHKMKAFAVATNTLVVMQSQAPREKAGIGDLELNKDAAYGTVFFESYCDYLVTIWQPVKRCYDDPSCPTVTAFKFCKIRHKNVAKDNIKEDVRYMMMFDPNTQLLREMTQNEHTSFNFFNNSATNLRKQDRKTDLIEYTSITWTKGDKEDGKTNHNQDSSSATTTDRVH